MSNSLNSERIVIDTQDLGRRIKRLRESFKYTQTQVGNYLGISYQQIQAYEKGRVAPSIQTLVNLAQLFKVSIYYLLYGDKVQSQEGKYLLEYLPALKKRAKKLLLDKLIQMLTIFANMCRVNKTKLNKLLFYADFIHCRDYSNPISYVPYVKLPYGPAPESYNALLAVLQETNVIEINSVVLNGERDIIEEKIQSKAVIKPNIFSDTEFGVIRKVAFKLGDKTAGELSKLSHQEPFYQEIEVGKEIPYELAKEIKLKL